MGLNRRQLLQGALGLGAAAGLAGCSGLTSRETSEAPQGGTDGENVTLTFVNWSGDAEKAAFDKLIAAFQSANPTITVRTDTVPYASIQTNLDTRFQSGNPPDLFRVSYIDIGQYTSQGVLLDVSETVGKRSAEFVPGLWEGVVYDGKPYGVPHQIDTTAILYRLDAFEAAKITNVPTSLEEAWSWEEFAEASRKLAGVVKGNQSPFIYDWQSAGAYRWLTWLFAAGGTLLGPDLKSPAIDSPEGRKALQFTQSFFTNRWVAKNTSVKSTTYPDGAFIAGTVAMAFAGSFLLPGIESGLKGKVEYGSMPQPKDVQAATDLGGNAIVAAKDGPNTDAALKFLDFVAGEEQMKTYCEATGQLPTLTSLTKQELDFDVRPDLMPTFVQQATTLTPEQVKQVTVPQFAQLNQALQNELEQAFLGGRSVDATIAALATAVQKAGG